MNFKIIIIFISLFLITLSGFAQEAFRVNIFVDADKNIYLEDRNVTIGELSKETKDLIYKQPATKYNRLVFNIYGDKNLKHGFIMDINHKLLSLGKGLKSKTNKYLLEYKNINLDDSAWQEEIKSLQLDAVKD
ncbi:hypothetical protein APR41_11825 [Salegentibacter salinarum]|uniref:Uncharacterized protein n=1 Tax=Salegentibacter salinarum TaxID=447422 RepID=A0A2N0U2H5_9FLAO|nr:hypothetical protein [Salegentibacter salinarum]PKD21098.1 hypothetical protein APR41_11825 [Salegentibacter salinarum]SKB75919.1 hypothetical protein SAMN05660903_02412 [Salegentibacter salinarum]